MIGKNIYESLSSKQKTELETDIKNMTLQVAKTNNLHFNKSHKVKSNIQLQGDIYLYVTIEFIFNPTGMINGIIKEIIKFDSIDQYIDSVNSQKKLNDWKDIM